MTLFALTISLLTGSIAGLLAGLLGVGGGLIIVPALTFLFQREGFPPQYVAHLALGTSLASIVFTSVSSFLAHHRHGNVMWSVVARIAPGIVVGTLGGSLLAGQLSTWFLKVFFILFALTVSVQMGFGLRPKGARQLPGMAGMSTAGLVIGGISSWVGIGGGSLTVPFLSWCNVDVKRAIGTSAAVGLPIAAAGAIGYLMAGWGRAGLPAYSAGFLYLPSLAAIVGMSVLTAPIGARAAQRLPVVTLKRAFALLLLAGAVKMAVSL